MYDKDDLSVLDAELELESPLDDLDTLDTETEEPKPDPDTMLLLLQAPQNQQRMLAARASLHNGPTGSPSTRLTSASWTPWPMAALATIYRSPWAPERMPSPSHGLHWSPAHSERWTMSGCSGCRYGPSCLASALARCMGFLARTSTALVSWRMVMIVSATKNDIVGGCRVLADTERIIKPGLTDMEISMLSLRNRCSGNLAVNLHE